MTGSPPNQLQFQRGFTLLEMLIAIAVLALTLVWGVPSFQEAAERRRIDGAAQEIQARIALARSEAIKRNEPVSVAFVRTSASTWCLGIRNDDRAGCDCTQSSQLAGDYCGIDDDFSTEPAAQEQRLLFNDSERLNLSPGPFFAGSGDGGTNGFVFDPIRGALSDVTDAGSVLLTTAEAGYQLSVSVNGLGLSTICRTEFSRPLGSYRAC